MTPPGERRFRVLVNPASGGGRAPAAAAAVAERLTAAGAAVTVLTSAGVAQCQLAVAEAVSRGEIVVAAGGDGMLASIAGAVVRAGGVLGLAPAGRGNDFARMLGLPRDPAAVARTLLDGVPAPIDVIDVDGHVVLGSVYAGVDSLASALVDRARWLPPALQYPYAAVRALLTHTPGPFTLTVDGRDVAVEAYNVVVANSGFYGKGMHIAPAADVTDGLLDVVVIPAGSRLRMVRLLPRVYEGSHVTLPGVLTLRGREVRIAGGAAPVGYGDGERIGPLPLTARVVPGGIAVLLPAAPR